MIRSLILPAALSLLHTAAQAAAEALATPAALKVVTAVGAVYSSPAGATLTFRTEDGTGGVFSATISAADGDRRWTLQIDGPLTAFSGRSVTLPILYGEAARDAGSGPRAGVAVWRGWPPDPASFQAARDGSVQLVLSPTAGTLSIDVQSPDPAFSAKLTGPYAVQCAVPDTASVGGRGGADTAPGVQRVDGQFQRAFCRGIRAAF